MINSLEDRQWALVELARIKSLGRSNPVAVDRLLELLDDPRAVVITGHVEREIRKCQRQLELDRQRRIAPPTMNWE